MHHQLEIRRGRPDVLRLTGRFGQEAAEALYDAVLALGAGSGVVLDLAGIDWIGSSAIGCIVRLSVDHGPVVIRPSECVRRALDLAEVSMFLSLCDSVEEGASRLALAEGGRG